MKILRPAQGFRKKESYNTEYYSYLKTGTIV